MSHNNISKLFYKDYYNEVDFRYILTNTDEVEFRSIKDINRKILEKSQLVSIPKVSLIDKKEAKSVCIQAKIAYPGLVTGTGLVHDSKKLKGAFNLGMHFDYTYGMPIVYGSSVKGVLRSYFKEFCSDLPKDDIDELFEAIFNGKERDPENPTKKDGTFNYRNISIYKRDVFFDAVITEACKGRFLEDDSITPHGDNPLKNPVPIAMLKIAAGCTLEFRFYLNETITHSNNKYDVQFKKERFEKILETVGVGAKTNVGYGQLNLL